MPQAAGTHVKKIGRYHVQEKLGTGGMAVVYRAVDPKLKRDVAIKLLHDHLADQDDFRARFEREAQMVASLNHANIIQIYDYAVVEHQGRNAYYMVMPYIPGQSLADILESYRRIGQRMPLRRVEQIMHDLGSALDYAHQHGVIHRDIKPRNILFDESGRTILTDFGIARLAQQTHLTQEGSLIGTPAYMSPEQATGLTVDARTDVYALGIVLYEVLTGQVPFEDDGTISVLLKHVQSEVPAVSDFLALPDDRLDHIIFRALAKKPEDRYASVSDFISDLSEAFETLSPQDLMRSTQPDTLVMADAKPRRTTVMETITSSIVEPVRKNPIAFFSLSVAIVALLMVARAVQVAPGASDDTTTGIVVESMTGELFFESIFDASDPYLAYWPTGRQDGVEKRMTDGTYELRVDGRNSATVTLFEPEYTYDNATITLDARLREDSPMPSAYGVAFRYIDPDNYHVFAVDGRGRYSIWQRRDGTWIELRDLSSSEEWTDHDAINPRGERNDVTVMFYFNTLTGYVNGEKVVEISVDDNAVTEGSIGIYVATPSSGGGAMLSAESYEVFPAVPSTPAMTGS